MKVFNAVWAVCAVVLVQAPGCGRGVTGQSDAGTGGEGGSSSGGEGGDTDAAPTTEAASGSGTATGGSSGETGASSGTTGALVLTGTTVTTGEVESTTGATEAGTTEAGTTEAGTTEAGTSEDSETGEDTGGACLPDCVGGPVDPYVDCVVSFDPAPATVQAGGFGHELLPDVVLGAPGGSADVVSLGCGGEVVLGFDEPFIVDGVGADFIVFENPFNISFPEPGRVEVSEDGCAWSAFPCDTDTLVGCAGKSVTKAVPNSGVDPTDPAVAGGDAFDLAAVGLEVVRYVRIVDVSEAYWGEMGQSFCDPGQGGKGGFDLNAVAVVHG